MLDENKGRGRLGNARKDGREPRCVELSDWKVTVDTKDLRLFLQSCSELIPKV